MTTPGGTPLIAYSLTDSAGTVLAERLSGEQFYAASTIKIGVMLAAAIEIDASRLAFDEVLLCRRRFESTIAGSPSFAVAEDDQDPQFPEDGAEATVAELLDMMITRSSNEATNLIVERVGLPAIAAALCRSGADDTKMERAIGDVAAVDAGLTNLVTTADLVTLMRCIVTGRLSGAETTAFMRSTLIGQQFRRISAELPAGTTWGSKSGNVPGIVHDVAFVGDPDSTQTRYLSVCTYGYGDEEGQEIIRALAHSTVVSPAIPRAAPSERCTVSLT